MTGTEGFFERLGVRYFNRLYRKIHAKDYIHIKGLPSDQTLQVIVKNITQNSIIIAFLAGALTTVPSVLIEILYKSRLDMLDYYLYQGITITVMLILELGVLYWLGLNAVHALANLTGHHALENDPNIPLSYQVEKLMVRTALEIPDPVINYLGINPVKNISQNKMLLMSLLYKAKVILTSLVLRVLLQKVTTRFGLRMGFAWVAIPVTAVWDAIVMHKVIMDAKLRLFGYQLSQYIIHEIFTAAFLKQLTPQCRIAAIRAVASVMVLANQYHPNNILLLIKLSENLDIKEDGDYDDWDQFLKSYEHVSPHGTKIFTRSFGHRSGI